MEAGEKSIHLWLCCMCTFWKGCVWAGCCAQGVSWAQTRVRVTGLHRYLMVPGFRRENLSCHRWWGMGQKELHLSTRTMCNFLESKISSWVILFLQLLLALQTFATKSFVKAQNSANCKDDEMLGHARFSHQQFPFMSACVICTASRLGCQGQGGSKKHSASQGSKKHVHETSPVSAHPENKWELATAWPWEMPE